MPLPRIVELYLYAKRVGARACAYLKVRLRRRWMAFRAHDGRYDRIRGIDSQVARLEGELRALRKERVVLERAVFADRESVLFPTAAGI